MREGRREGEGELMTTIVDGAEHSVHRMHATAPCSCSCILRRAGHCWCWCWCSCISRRLPQVLLLGRCSIEIRCIRLSNEDFLFHLNWTHPSIRIRPVQMHAHVYRERKREKERERERERESESERETFTHAHTNYFMTLTRHCMAHLGIRKRPYIVTRRPRYIVSRTRISYVGGCYKSGSPALDRPAL